MPTFDEVYSKASSVPGLCAKEELEFIFNTIQQNSLVRAIELGCYCGSSTITIAEAMPQGQVIAVDEFKIDFDAQSFTGDDAFTIFNKNVLSVYKNVRLHKTSTDIAARYIKSCDFLFIDADHSYEAVLSDCFHYLKKLKPGGIVMFHDYTNEYFPGVKKVVDELTGYSVYGSVWSIMALRKS